MLVLVLRSPFNPLLVALILIGDFALFEYSVSARNYGISMLLLFLIAASYGRHRERGVVLGGLLFLLANTNVHSTILAVAFLLFWVIDIWQDERIERMPALRTFALNAALVAVGIALCFITVYPTYNDAAVAEGTGRSAPAELLKMIFPAPYFIEMLAPARLTEHLDDVPVRVVVSVFLYATTLGLVRRPGAFLAAVASLAGLALVFTAVYPGSYRHVALWLAFLIALYWIVYAQPETALRAHRGSYVRPLELIGWGAFVVLLAMQAQKGVVVAAQIVGNGPPFSESRNFGAFVRSRPELRDAVIIADPDYLLEPLPYYIDNRTYLLREQRFGRVVRFTRSARMEISLEDILSTARRLRQETGKPIVILLSTPLDPDRARSYREGIGWTLNTTPPQVHAFRASTRLMKHFGPALSDEMFDAYVLAPGIGGSLSHAVGDWLIWSRFPSVSLNHAAENPSARAMWSTVFRCGRS
jgi:hypothetical protein